MSIRRTGPVAFALGMLTVLSIGSKAVNAENAAPAATVKTYQAGLIDVMKRGKALGFAGRYKALNPVVRRAFDLAYVGRRALGRTWRKLDAAKRAAYSKKFAILSISTHAGQFRSFGGEAFSIVGTDDPGRGYKLVRTILTTGGGDKIQLNYLMQKRQGVWKIIDVFAKGTISEVATRRAEFGAVIRKDGFDALLQELDRKIAGQRTP